MALIKCSECGKDVSDKADACVHCGAKIKLKSNNKQEKDAYTKPKKKITIIVIIGFFILLSILGTIFFIVLNKNDNSYYDNSHYDNSHYDNSYYDNSHYDNNYNTINESKFENYKNWLKNYGILKDNEDKIIVFTQESCPHCEQYEPILEQAKNNFSTTICEVNVVDINTSDLKGISGTPTTLLIKNGKVVDEIRGSIEYEELANKIKNANLN